MNCPDWAKITQLIIMPRLNPQSSVFRCLRLAFPHYHMDFLVDPGVIRMLMERRRSGGWAGNPEQLSPAIESCALINNIENVK